MAWGMKRSQGKFRKRWRCPRRGFAPPHQILSVHTQFTPFRGWESAFMLSAVVLRIAGKLVNNYFEAVRSSTKVSRVIS